MTRIKIGVLACLLTTLSVSTFAVDGVTLISQSTVTAAGGFPYRITHSGSYKLASNLDASGSVTDAIDIDADNVVLDLNGFTITGPCGLGLCSGDGIASFSHHTITIKNGVVSGWFGGINLAGSQVGALVEEVHANNNSGTGIDVGDGIVRRCTTTGDFVGISVDNYGVVESNVSSKNADGFLLFNTTATGNTAVGNTNFGLSALGDTVYGSNVFSGNKSDAGGGVSQNNNVCTGGATC